MVKQADLKLQGQNPSRQKSVNRGEERENCLKRCLNKLMYLNYQEE
jgi:hypothetical protein